MNTTVPTSGDLHGIRGEIKFEWKIKDFLKLFKNGYESPAFSFCGVPWVITISLNDYAYSTTVSYKTVRFGSSIIIPTLPFEKITVDYSLRFKTADGKVDTHTGCTGTEVFRGIRTEYAEVLELISISELVERKSELLPSGILTLICTLKESHPVSVDDALRFTPTVKAVAEFRQTEKETGDCKLQEHFKKILDNGNLSDVILKVDGKEFKSHRCILAARSPVFLAMMTHETKEKNTGVVDIPDVDANTFSDFLHYLYTGSKDIITPENVVNLFIAADKYQVDELKKNCLDYMLKNISVDNFCDILSLSLVHAEKNLIDACSRFYIENSLPIVKTTNWLMFATKNPVAANELNIKQLENNMKTKDKNMKTRDKKWM